MHFDINKFLKQIAEKGVSDVHLRIGKAPTLRIGGSIIKIRSNPLTEFDFENILKTILHKDNMDKVIHLSNFDFTYELKDVSRYRVNFCKDLGMPKLTMRLVPLEIPSIEDLGLPSSIKELSTLNNGIVLITGPTGSGKSTTIASILSRINQNSAKHIVTIEDPIEFLYTDQRCLVTQRNIGIDVDDFSSGIKYALRQDPDVILVGEIRDRETIETALAAAETGHLVFSTIHTNSAVQTVNRIINMFDEQQRTFATERLANCLRATVAQKLIPKIKTGRAPAIEIMTVTPTIKDYILKRNFEQIYELMKRGEYSDMRTMNLSLYELFKSGLISKEEAMLNSDAKNELTQMMSGVFHGTGVKVSDKFV